LEACSPVSSTSAAGMGLNGLQMFRWLVGPIAFVVTHWCLLAMPTRMTALYPTLWATGGKGIMEVLPPHPKTRSEAFELGWQASLFEEARCGNTTNIEEQPQRCKELLRRAAEAVGSAIPLLPSQLRGSRAFLVELEAERSIVDRVSGFLNFVNIIWMVSIIGILVTVGPFIAYFIGPMLIKLASALVETVIVPAAKFLHKVGFFEFAAWALALGFSIQGSRYPAGQADAARMVALTGGLAFMPCWVYSTCLNTPGGGGHQNEFFCISCFLLSAVLVPLAIIHGSSLIGFIAILAIYGGLGFVAFAACGGFFIGFNSSNSLHRCLFASVVLVVIFVSLRIVGVDVRFLQPFSTGAMVLGNVMYFLALLINSHGWGSNSQTYVMRNALMLGSLIVATFLGSVFVMPAMTNTATTFLVLWLMEKETEVQWKGFGIVIVFANFVALYFIAHYLHTHPETVTGMFDPSGIFT